MKRSNRLVILVGVLLAVMAFVGIVVLLGQEKTGPAVQKTTVQVLVAQADIAIGDSVTPDKVKIVELEPDAVLGTRVADPSLLTGKPALFPVAKGQQVSQELFGTTGNFCIACQLQPGEKAIAFEVDPATGLNFLIQPGDHIDIIFREAVDAAVDKPLATVKTVLQDKRVLYVSTTNIQPIADPNASPQPDGATEPVVAPVSAVIIFAGTDSDAEVIHFAQTDNGSTKTNQTNVVGTLMAVLRAPKDVAVEATTGITLQILIETFGVPVPRYENPLPAESPAP